MEGMIVPSWHIRKLNFSTEKFIRYPRWKGIKIQFTNTLSRAEPKLTPFLAFRIPLKLNEGQKDRRGPKLDLQVKSPALPDVSEVSLGC